MNSADDLTARLQHIAERTRQRQRERTPEPTSKPAPVVRLPLWPAELRTCPSCVLRSALFGVVQRGDAKPWKAKSWRPGKASSSAIPAGGSIRPISTSGWRRCIWPENITWACASP